MRNIELDGKKERRRQTDGHIDGLIDKDIGED